MVEGLGANTLHTISLTFRVLLKISAMTELGKAAKRTEGELEGAGEFQREIQSCAKGGGGENIPKVAQSGSLEEWNKVL